MAPFMSTEFVSSCPCPCGKGNLMVRDALISWVARRGTLECVGCGEVTPDTPLPSQCLLEIDAAVTPEDLLTLKGPFRPVDEAVLVPHFGRMDFDGYPGEMDSKYGSWKSGNWSWEAS